MSAVPITPGAELAELARSWPTRAESLKIEDPETLTLASEELLIVKALQQEAHSRFDPICAANHTAWKVALAQRATVIEPLEKAEVILKTYIATYQTEQQRLRRAEQDRLELTARELREQEAEEELEREVEAAEANGATAGEVERIIAQETQRIRSEPTPAVYIKPVFKPAGIGMRDSWQAEITDLQALIKYVAANPQFTMLLAPNMTAINGMARSLKSAFSMPGVRVTNGAIVSARRF